MKILYEVTGKPGTGSRLQITEVDDVAIIKYTEPDVSSHPREVTVPLTTWREMVRLLIRSRE